MNRYIINISDSMNFAKPMVTRFSSGFDTIAFVPDTAEDISDCSFAVAVSALGDCFMLTEDGTTLSRTDENGKLCIEWNIGREITAKDGIVIYQLIAYRADESGNTESIWYSPQGRIVVGESIELTEYETAHIGSQPSIVMQILSKVDANKAHIDDAFENMQTHKIEAVIDHPDKSVTKEKLSESLQSLLNRVATQEDMQAHKIEAVIDHPDKSVTMEKLSENLQSLLNRVATQDDMQTHKSEAVIDHPDKSVTKEKLSEDLQSLLNTVATEDDMQNHKSALVIDHPDKSVTKEKLSESLQSLLNRVATEDDMQNHKSTAVLDHPDKSVTKEKLSENLQSLLNTVATEDYVQNETAQLKTRLDQADRANTACANRVSKIEQDCEQISQISQEALSCANEGIRGLVDTNESLNQTQQRLDEHITDRDSTFIICSAQGDDINLYDSAERALTPQIIYGKSVYSNNDENPSPDNPLDIKHISQGEEICVDVGAKNIFDTDKFVELVKKYDYSATEQIVDGRRCLKFNIQALHKKDFSSVVSLNPNKVYTWSMDIKFAQKNSETATADCWLAYGWLYNNEIYNEASLNNSVFGVPLKNRRIRNSMYDFVDFHKVSITSYLSSQAKVTGIGFTYNDRGWWYVDLDSIQLEEGSEYSEYTPYIHNGGIVVSPLELRGVPASSNGNCTDSSGRQWISDELNIAEAYYIKRVKEFYPGDIYNVSKTGTTEDGLTVYTGYGAPEGEFDCLPYGGMCNIAKNSKIESADDGEWSFNLISLDNGLCTYQITGFASTEQEFKTKAKTAVYLLPVVKYEKILTDTLQNISLPELKTYKPSTHITVSDGICMEFSYTADTKEYIDRKINSLSETVAQLAAQIIG